VQQKFEANTVKHIKKVYASSIIFTLSKL